MMKMQNVTLENYKTQCDSVPFIFPKMGTYKEIINADTGQVIEKVDLSIVQVPDRLAPLLADQMKTKGVFIIPSDPAEYEEAKRQAMINYLNGRLKTRITNYLLQKDEYEKRGSTFQYTDGFNEALKWDKEIRFVLNQQRPIKESGSFLDHFNVAAPTELLAETKELETKSPFDNLPKTPVDSTLAKYPPRRGRPKADLQLEANNG